MGSRLQSNETAPTAKVDTLMPSAIFHSFLTTKSLNPLSRLRRVQDAAALVIESTIVSVATGC